MRRTVYILSAVLLCVVVMGSDSPKEYDGRTQVLNPLQGKWRPLKVEVTNKTGKIICTNGAETADVVFKDERYIWSWADGYSRLTTCRGIYTLDFSKSPGHLDLTDRTGPLAGVTRRCIYRIDGETLEIASTTDHPANRPESFAGHVTIYTLKRVK